MNGKKQHSTHSHSAGGFNRTSASSFGSFTDELLSPAEGIRDGFKSLTDLNTWLGTAESTPEQEEERARKEVILQNFNKMTAEEQAIAKQRYQEWLQHLQQEEEEKQQKAQLQAEEQSQSLQVPSTPKKGPVGPAGSQKQKAVTKLQQNRQQLSSPGGAN